MSSTLTVSCGLVVTSYCSLCSEPEPTPTPPRRGFVRNNLRFIPLSLLFLVSARRTPFFSLCPVPCALCPEPCALCPVPCALCPEPCALCPVPWSPVPINRGRHSLEESTCHEKTVHSIISLSKYQPVKHLKIISVWKTFP